jgi:large repetitive protein
VDSTLKGLGATVAAAAALLCLAAPAQADRNITARFSENEKGAILHTGNTLMTCPTTAATCPAAQNGTATGNAANNNGYSMVYVDIDGNGSTINSSSASVNLPVGAEVLFAGLYYGGNTAVGGEASRATTLVDTPAAGGYTTVTASVIDDFVSTDASQHIYGGFADITALVSAGGSGTYTVANVQSSLGADKHAAWSIVVAYRDEGEPPRNLTVLDGLIGINPNQADRTFTVSGFQTVPSGPVNADLGFIVYEGDLGLTGDSIFFDGTTLADRLTDANNPADNFNNSTISFNGSHFSQKNPNYVNQLGADNDIINADGLLANNQTNAQLTLRTTADRWIPQVITFAPEIFSPDIPLEKSAIDLNGGLLLAGDIIEWRITGTNVGQETARDLIIGDPMPANTTYVPNSLREVVGFNTGNKTDAADADQAEYSLTQDRVTFRVGDGANATQGGRLRQNENFEVRFQTRIDAGTPPETVITNVAEASYRGEQTGVEYNVRTDPTDPGGPTEFRPEIALDKTGPATIRHGGTLSYNLVATNPGEAPLSNVTVTDADCSPISAPAKTNGDQDALLEPGEVWTYTCSRAVPAHSGGEEDPFVNDARATGAYNGVTVDDADTVSTDILHDGIQVVKTGPAGANHGVSVTYDFAVSLAGDNPTTGVSLTDDRCSPITGPIRTGGDQDTTLEVGEAWNYSCTNTVPAQHSPGETDPIVNTATVTGTAGSGGGTVSDTDDHSLDITHPPGIDIQKTGPAGAEHGENITYTLAVTSTGDAPLQNVTPTDSDCGAISAPTRTGGDQDNLLEPGETWTYTCQRAVPAHNGGEANPLLNTASVAAQPQGGGGAVSDSDGHSIDIQHPQIELGKSGPQTATHGQAITYTLVATNPGDVPISNVAPADPDCGSISAPTRSGGDQDNLLEPGETWTYTCQRAVPAHNGGEADPIQNTATITGSFNGTQVSDTDGHSVDILHANINVATTGPASVLHGEDITYNYAVTTTGDPLSGVSVSDPGCSPISQPAKTGGDQDNLLEPGETWTYTCTTPVPSHTGGEDDPIENTATASGTNGAGNATDSDGHSVDIRHPSLEVRKTGPAGAQHGQSVTYAIAAENTGDVALTNVEAIDPDCGPVGQPTKSGGDQDNQFEPGETWAWTCSRAVPAHSQAEADPLGNTATVSGDNGGQTYSDSDNHNVDIQHPRIALDLSAPPTVAHGGHITYTYAVTTPGDVPISNVAIDDPDCTPISGPAKSGGDQDNLLEPGETWTFECTEPVPPHAAGEPNPIDNSARVTGSFSGTNVADVDTASSEIVHPELRVVKDGPAAADHGDTMSFSYAVSNQGTGAISDVTLEDDQCSPVSAPTKTGGDQDNLLEPGETWSYTCSRAVPAHSQNEADPFVNTATVDGEVAGATFTDRDVHITDIRHPDDADLALQKTGPAEVEAGGRIAWTLIATNLGPGTASNALVTDTLPVGVTFVPGASSPGCAAAAGQVVTCTIGSLASGADSTFTVAVDVPLGLAGQTLTNAATVSADGDDANLNNNDDQANTVVRNAADLSITKTGPASALTGNELSFTIVVANNGPSAATNVTVTDSLPNGLTHVSTTPSQGSCSAVGRNVTCDLGAIANGASAQITLRARVANSLAGRSTTNTAQVDSDELDPNPSDNSDDARVPIVSGPGSRADLEVKKTITNGFARVGNELTYEITVRNLGPDPATRVELTDTLSGAVELRSVQTSKGACVQSLPMTCSLGRLNPGQRVRITVVVELLEEGRLINTAAAVSPETDPNPDNSNDGAEAIVDVRRTEVDLTKAVSDRRIGPGERFSYRIVFENFGPEDALDVEICDKLPQEVLFVQAIGGVYNQRRHEVCWTEESVPADTALPLNIVVRAQSNLPNRKKVRNVVTATGSNFQGQAAAAFILCGKAFTGRSTA